MLFATPGNTPGLRDSLDQLDRLRRRLGQEEGKPSPWVGSLRREVRASAAGGSTAIEGFSVTPEEALALVGENRFADLDEDENRMAVVCYARAMDRVAVLAMDPIFRWLDRVILDLHFDACSFQREQSPGLWRTGPIGITGSDGRIAYRGPEAEEVPALMGEVIDWLQEGDLDTHPVVRAAMAHLYVISIHPFRDGNGRISRIVQSLVLAREGMVSAEFGSIEEYLAQHTADYYAALNEAHGESYEPDRDVSGWVEFCVKSHLAQTQRRIDQVEEAAVRWQHLEKLAAERGWPVRLVIALEQSLRGRSDRAGYASEAEVSPATATADLRRLLDAGAVEQKGRGRNVCYTASEWLRAELRAVVESGVVAEESP